MGKISDGVDEVCKHVVLVLVKRGEPAVRHLIAALGYEVQDARIQCAWLLERIGAPTKNVFPELI